MFEQFFHDPVTVLDCINIAKVCTGIVILFLAGRFGFTPRSSLYASLHLSYLTWWLSEQYFFPPFWGRFGDSADVATGIVVLMVIGVFYALPAFFAFSGNRVVEISPFETILCVMLFTMGCLINTTADVHMKAFKAAIAPQKSLVTDGLYRLCQNPNYFGDQLRYASFCLASGKVWSFFLLVLVVSMNLGSLHDPNQKGGMKERYGQAFEQWTMDVPNQIVPSLDAGFWMMAGLVATTWGASYGAGKALRGTGISTTIGHAKKTA